MNNIYKELHSYFLLHLAARVETNVVVTTTTFKIRIFHYMGVNLYKVIHTAVRFLFRVK